MGEPIRILQVIGLMNRGGAETMIMNLYRNIDRDRVQFDFVENSFDKAAYDEEIRSLGGRIYRCKRYSVGTHISYCKWWDQFFSEHGNDYAVVHGHLGSTAAIYLSIAKKYGIATIAHSHNIHDKGLKSLPYRIYTFPVRYIASAFLTCSNEAGISRFGRKIAMDHSKCHTLNNAIDIQRFQFNQMVRNRIRAELGLNDQTVVIGHIGRFQTQKNHLFLIDIFKEYHDENSNSLLLLVGDGILRPDIENKIQEYGIDSAVRLVGVCENTYDYYQAMDYFVMPSLYEGLPVTMVEAQTAGLSCVVSDRIPTESAITDLVTFLSLDEPAVFWADYILKMPIPARKNMENQIREHGFDISQTSSWLMNYYEKLAENHE